MRGIKVYLPSAAGFVSGILLFLSAPNAADMPKKVQEPAKTEAASAMCKETKALTTDIFGFSGGSDVADLNTWGGSLEYNRAFGTRVGPFNSSSLKAQASTSPFPCIEIGPSLNGVITSTKDREANANYTSHTEFGAVEMKYKILGRAQNGFGLTVSVEPGAGQSHTGSADASVKANVYTNTAKILIDRELVENKLYGAFNLEYASSFTGIGSFARASGINFRAALATKLSDNFYIGADASHQRIYDGAFANRYQGSAWFLGPTFFWQASEKLAVSGTVAFQVAGRSQANGGPLNLDQFNRQLAKLKLGYSF